MSGLTDIAWTSTLGVLLPESLVRSHAFAVLAAFVAINTMVYATLATAKALPKVFIRDHVPRSYERAETRSIYPDEPV